MEEFFEELHDGNRATYGFDQTRENLMMGAVDRLLISEDLRKDVVVYDCPDGRTEYGFINAGAEKPDHECSDGTAIEGEREDAIEHLMDLAGQRGTETIFVSTDFEKGEQLLNAFGGVAGILRYSTGI
jgi:Peptide chain release factor 1 (eRF1)